MAVQELNARVISKMEFSPGNFVLRVAPVGWELADFTPGQYSVLGLFGSAPRSVLSDPEEKPLPADKLIRRAYSIASSSMAREYLEFYIAVVRSGALTPRLYNLEIGDMLWLGKKCVGLMTLEEVPEEANVILIATGTGVAPYMSMLRTLAASKGFARKYAVFQCACHSWDLGYRSELEVLSNMSPNFYYFPVISEPDKEQISWAGLTGFAFDAWKSGVIENAWGFHPTPEDSHIFLCGNPLMIDSAIEFLGKERFNEHKKREPGEIHLERF
ncbi:ferredoxin--NADP reductase [Candidatus Riflebacteria bacterium]